METDRIRLKVYLMIFIALLAAGSLGFMILENLSLVDSFYFSIVTMATVGYGDIHPQTVVGKILALLLIVGGVGTFLGVVASIQKANIACVGGDTRSSLGMKSMTQARPFLDRLDLTFRRIIMHSSRPK